MLQAVRDSEREAREILAVRERQEADIKLATPFFEITREISLENEEEPEEEVVAKSEYIAPFLPPGGLAALTTRQQALAVRAQCLQVCTSSSAKPLHTDDLHSFTYLGILKEHGQ